MTKQTDEEQGKLPLELIAFTILMGVLVSVMISACVSALMNESYGPTDDDSDCSAMRLNGPHDEPIGTCHQVCKTTHWYFIWGNRVTCYWDD